MLFGWWGSFLFLPETFIPWFALGGLLLGFGFALWRWPRALKRLYMIDWLSCFGVMLFYVAGMFGFFMGVPVFHVLLVIPAGLYWGRRMKTRQFGPSETRKQRRRLVWVMGGLTGLVAAISGLIAWNDPYTLANLRGMLQLQLTWLFVKVTIWVGGFAMVVAAMMLTRLSFGVGQKSVSRKEE
jgi:hypothetical protein